MNLFRVIVRKITRRGNGESLVDFIVSTESNQNEVYNYYYNLYYGLMIDVTACTALNLDFPKQTELKTPEAKTTSTNVLTINQVKLNNAEKDKLKVCKEIKQKYSCALSDLEYTVIERLQKDFSGLMNCYNSGVSVTIEDGFFNIKATIAINGSIDDVVDYMIQKGA